ELRLVEFESFSGIDGELYLGRGLTISPGDYQAVGVMSFAAPAGTDNKILRRAVEERSIRESNAYVFQYELGISQNFKLSGQYGDGVGNGEEISI
ncbi:MAG: hypothetical protein IIA83_09605, partial [Thaumarchaeota archaeon]|nr:hypothetical protein [Nitrososphaerota archaeon]